MMTRLSFLFAFCFTLLCGKDTSAQTWVKKHEVDGNISYVGFNKRSANSQIGFFGVMGSSYELWRTSDGGETWNKVDIALNAAPVDMTFKDAMTGWMTTGLAQTGSVYKTTDAGLTWIKQPLDHPGSGIVYVPATRLLFVSIWPDATTNDASFVSSNEGASWETFNVLGLNGFTFSDGQKGMAAVLFDRFIRTTNGGLTWQPLDWNLETWQPLAIPNTNTYFIASEANEVLYRTDDHGTSWQLIHVFPGDRMNLTGDLRGDLCGMVVQAESKTDPNYHGFLISQDEGITWTTIGGPGNFSDTRFDLVGKAIFAGESRDFADKLPRGLWKYVLPADVGATEAKLLIEFFDEEKMKTLTPDQRARVNIHLSAAIPGEMNVGAIQFDIVYDASAASIAGLTAQQGWTITQTPIANGTRIQLSKTPGSEITTSTLVSFELKPFFGLSENRTVMLENITIGNAPQQPIECFVINSLGDEIAYDLSFNNCEDSLLLRMLDGRSPLEILSIRPNPANTSQIVSVELVAASDGDASFSLISSDGKIVKTEQRSLSVGHNGITLATQGLSSGAYTLVAQSPGFARRRNIVIR